MSKSVYIEKSFSKIVKEKGITVSMKIGFELDSPSVKEVEERSKKTIQLCKRLVDRELTELC